MAVNALHFDIRWSNFLRLLKDRRQSRTFRSAQLSARSLHSPSAPKSQLPSLFRSSTSNSYFRDSCTQEIVVSILLSSTFESRMF